MSSKTIPAQAPKLSPSREATVAASLFEPTRSLSKLATDADQPIAPALIEATKDCNLVETLALLVANGVPIEKCAQHTGRSTRVLEAVMWTPGFTKRVKELAADTEHDVASKVILGSGLDCVLRLVQLRDDPQTATKHKIEICKYLLDRGYFNKHMDQMKKSYASTTMEAVEKSGGLVGEALNDDIIRTIKGNADLAAHPLLSGLLNGFHVPEPEQQGLPG